MIRTFLAILLVAAPVALLQAEPKSSVQVYFSPNGGCTDAIVKQLAGATNSIYVQAYSFTSTAIAKALVDAHRRGVRVQVILDKSQKTEKYSSADFLRNSGVPPLIDAAHAIAHNKIMIIDKRVVITGSFNFTTSAEERNAENLLIIRNSDLASRYLANWQNHVEHSERYQGHQAVAKKQKTELSLPRWLLLDFGSPDPKPSKPASRK